MLIRYKTLYISFFSLILFINFFLFPKHILATENFTVDTNADYKVQKTGTVSITNTITIRNNITTSFAKSYILTLSSQKPDNIKVFADGKELTPVIEKKDNKISVQIDFGAAALGKGSTQTFIVTYDDKTLAVKTGEVWEISLPKLTNPGSFREYDISLSVPSDFGDEAYVTPKPFSKAISDNRVNYHFKKNDIERSGIMLGFGQFQSYLLKLNYYLENTSFRSQKAQITLPPDTSLQKLYYQKIDPLPNNIEIDSDGNWLANYSLGPKQKLNITTELYAQIFAYPLKYIQPSPASLLTDLKPNQYWQSDSPDIKDLSTVLKTPENIYDYVVKTLTYDYNRVKPDAVRLGALAALKNPVSSICTEYTDLFIALTRSIGIPSREINGYAVSSNPKLQPLSLVADVLHSWPEYWDSQRKTWISVDPTWGNTSGIDYFNKLDLKHIAFAIHGQNPVTPPVVGSYKYAANPQKDIFVSLAGLPENRYPDIEIKIDPVGNFPVFSQKYKLSVENKGISAYYDLNVDTYLDNINKSSDYIVVLPPFSKFDKELVVNYGLLGTKTPGSILIKAGSASKYIVLDSKISIIYQLILICLALIAILAVFHIKTSGINIFVILISLSKTIYATIRGKLHFLKR